MTSRLIDKLLVNPNVSNAMRDQLGRSAIFSVDNVADYTRENKLPNSRDRDWVIKSQLPAITPPFFSTFIQFRYHNNAERGFLILRETVEDKGADAKWNVTCVSFSDDTPSIPQRIKYTFQIGHDGGLLANSPDDIDCHMFEAMERAMGRDATAMDMLSVDTGNTLMIMLWTLAFMNTKNVIMEAVEPSASINKKRVKHGKLPLMRYHVLKIKPIGRAANDSDSASGTGSTKALHIRRGHFMTFTDAAPMFGKLVGTFWVDQHIAGKKSDRVVVKDYEVVAE